MTSKMNRKFKKVGSLIVPKTSSNIRNSPRGALADRYKKLIGKINRSAMPVEDFDSDVRQAPKKTKPAISVPFVRVPSSELNDEDDE